MNTEHDGSCSTTPTIQVISLARTPARLEAFRADNPGLQGWSVFPAIDGLEIDAASRAALGDTALWTPGAVGNALSHIALWRLCVEQGAPLTICEDDAVLRRDFVAGSKTLLESVPGFDIVLWGWNYDAVLEVELAPGVGAAVVGDQASLRSAIGLFRQRVAPATLLKLRKALGTFCYTVSPAGASALLTRAVPFKPASLALPLMPHAIANVTPDVTLAGLYSDLSAHVAVPLLAVSRNDWSVSTIRADVAQLSPTKARAQADDLQAAGRLADAVQVMQAAALAAPGDSALWNRLGQLLAEQGHVAAAAVALETALRLEPRSEVALYNLARVRLLQARAEDALELLDAVVAVSPTFAAAHSNRGVALLALERPTPARAAFDEAVRLQPDLVEAWRGLSIACSALDDLNAAAQALEAALALAPNAPDLHESLARLHLRLVGQRRSEGDLAEAVRLAALAARAPGQRVEGLVAGSDLLERLGRFEESWDRASEAARLDPRSSLALNNLGVASLRLSRVIEAERAFRAAIALVPDYADAHHGLAFALLKQGRFTEAWPEYDWRLRTPSVAAWTRGFARPMWRGDTQPGATLLLAAEQGLGDTLQAACLIAEARPKVGSVVVQAPTVLAPLLRRMPGVDAVVDDGGARPPHDLWLPLMSLPGRLGVTLARRPPTRPHIAAQPELTAKWQARLPRDRLRVGVAWQGNPAARVEHGRSFPLAAMAPLAARPKVALVSLQKGFGVEQLDVSAAALGVVDLGEPYRAGGFEDTAAVISNLDLVICCDTAVAHLAGALGTPVWIALGHNPDWRWPPVGDETPWYASARLFRRDPGAPWTDVFTAMALQLDRLIAT